MSIDWQWWRSTDRAELISTQWSWPVCYWTKWFAKPASLKMSCPIAYTSATAPFGTQYAPIWVLSTDYGVPYIHRPRANPTANIRHWKSLAIASATSSKITGLSSYLWWNSRTTTWCMLQWEYFHSGLSIIAILKCISRPQTCLLTSSQRSKRMLCSKACKRLTELFKKTWSRLKNDTHGMPGVNKSHLKLQMKILALEETLPDYQAIKEAWLQAHWTINGK